MMIASDRGIILFGTEFSFTADDFVFSLTPLTGMSSWLRHQFWCFPYKLRNVKTWRTLEVMVPPKEIWTENGQLVKLFCFSSNFDETWWNCTSQWVLQLHQVLWKLDEKQKSFINCLLFCPEFQSVSRIVKIVHSTIRHH